MDIRQFRSELAHAFEAAGFERKKVKHHKGTVWLLPGHEVERTFWEHAMRRPWGFLLGGSLRVDVPSFRTWLNAKSPAEAHGVLHASLLGRLIANEPDMFFAVVVEPPPYDAWTQSIRARLAALPDTIEGLLRTEQEPERLRLVWDNWTAPKAWSYFKARAVGDEPKSPPPFMLLDGQIVDAAANDST
uniref:hypothetical protein n=1 Tax=uncultured Sphingomonas sp. TaxID=158754 RepID=UPI0025E594CD|nr:hypothetical protein [uncultured Sphingomonas sp.]